MLTKDNSVIRLEMETIHGEEEQDIKVFKRDTRKFALIYLQNSEIIFLNKMTSSFDCKNKTINSLSVFRGLERPWQVEAH